MREGEGVLYDGYYTEWWLWLVLSIVIVLGRPSISALFYPSLVPKRKNATL
jgi:hypothetical protein